MATTRWLVYCKLGRAETLTELGSNNLLAKTSLNSLLKTTNNAHLESGSSAVMGRALLGGVSVAGKWVARGKFGGTVVSK